MRALTAAPSLLLLSSLIATAPAAATIAGAGDAGIPPVVSTKGSVGAGASPSPCADGKYALLAPSGTRWRSTLSWSFRLASVPSGLSSAAVLATIERAFANVTGAHNDCGRADNVSATASYIGTTSLKPAVTAAGHCGNPDGHSVIGFGKLNSYYAGYTCIWWNNGAIIESDMRLGSDTSWALSSSGCANRLMMEALVTHEAGHAFGLAHVNESSHGRLTMSTYIDGLCENQEATLGLGDLKGLEKLY